MKRKLIVFLMSIVACAALLFAVSACSVTSDYSNVSSAYDGIDEAQKIVKTVQVTQGETLLGSKEETYELVEEGYRYTAKERRLNSIGEGDGNSAYTETVTDSKTVAADDVTFGSFPAESALSGAEYSGDEGDVTMTATLSDLSVLNLTAEDVDGSVSVSVEVGGGRMTSMEFTYRSQNGNSVEIAFVYTY